ncbi:MAG: hypothetical protein J6X55_02150 [Victivallales bacterium]|nr:hypothetical protein [Victivallales bacterium]
MQEDFLTDPANFYRESMDALAHFLGISPADAIRTMSDLLFTLHGLAKTLYNYRAEPQSAEYVQALTALDAVSGNLAHATLFQKLVKSLREAENDEGRRASLIEEFSVLIRYCHDNLGRG